VLDQSFLEAVQRLFWVLFPLSAGAAAISVAITRRRCIARTLLALVATSAAMLAIKTMQAQPLNWWQHFALSGAAFWVITMPPRHYWQSTMGALVFAQLVLHACWAVAPDLAREHWLGVTLIEYAKCLVLIAWSGGKRVELALGRAARLPARLVSLAPDRKPA
jgi:hypothetical protein